MAVSGPRSTSAEVEERVSTLELFFDLVFVFTITQLTSFLVAHPNGAGVVQVGLMFGTLWWMFGGYAWLTNTVPPRRPAQQVLILAAMAAFLVVALAIPDAFGESGIYFGAGYMVVTLIHTGLFLASSDSSIVRSMARLGPFNAITAGLILAGGFPQGIARWALWGAAVLLQWTSPYLASPSGIGLRSAHFVERHGLILLIALGESVVAVGIGLQGRALEAGRVVTAILGLATAAAMWWMFFGEEDRAAERALRSVASSKRAWLALYAFGHTFLVILLGIVVFAAGVKLSITAYMQPATQATAWFLAAGITLYVVGLAALRWILGTGRPKAFVGVAALVLATSVVGLKVSPEAQLACVAGVLILAIPVSHQTYLPMPPATSIDVPVR